MTTLGRTSPLLMALLLSLASCRGEVGTIERLDAALIDTGGDAALDASSDAPERGCSVLVPSACTSSAPRCIPGSDGENRCVEAGALRDGDACTAAGDGCAYGLLCASSEGEDTTAELVCRRICSPGARCPDGSTCPVTLIAGGEFVGLCPGA